jgi:hypothetical protein
MKRDVRYHFSHDNYLDFIRENTLGEKESLIKFYLEPKVHKVEIVFESNGGKEN